MKKTFVLGLLLGIGGAIALAGWYPFVEPVRFPAESTIVPNGGTAEMFHIRLPDDRLGRAGDGIRPVPDTIAYPADAALAGLSVELFRLRNDSGKVIGLAGRLDGAGSAEWTLLFPSRGALFLRGEAPAGFPYAAPARAGETLFGDVVGGTRQFDGFAGSYSEEWLLKGRTEDGELRGEIELATLGLRSEP